ncbi:MAG: hypothetical protein NTV43_02660 [Methylococcales bacterium]|nr:hypothetical protein [Methylococcales bacterium]
MIKISILFISLVMASIQVAKAASDDAWKAHTKEVVAACIKASELNKAKAIGDIIGFSDNTGYDALLISGTYPQAHMKNAKATVLCLFNRRSKAVEVAEAPSLAR